MTSDHADPRESQVLKAIYESLEVATPSERVVIVLRLIAEHPSGRLELPAMNGVVAMLDNVQLSVSSSPGRGSSLPGTDPKTKAAPAISLRGADLRGVRLRNAKLVGIDLRDANLQDAALGGADLRGALLEGADLQRADLAGANLAGAALGSADLRGAMLEDADLRRAGLRFAKLENAILENADLRRADLWGADLSGADLANSDLRRAVLRESNLRGADLARADLRGAICTRANFSDARLVGAKLQGLDLSTSEIARIRLDGAWLEKTKFRRAQLDGPIGEELDADYDAARKGYLALERAFQDSGDLDDASWAYKRRRRMQKLDTWRQARSIASKNPWRAGRLYLEWSGDQLVEWLCDYGESIPRVFIALLACYLFFTLAYGLTGSVVRLVETPAGLMKVVTRNPKDLAIFSLLAISTSGSPAVGLLPSSESVHILTAIEALLGIGLTGLLGFVVGNRVRR